VAQKGSENSASETLENQAVHSSKPGARKESTMLPQGSATQDGNRWDEIYADTVTSSYLSSPHLSRIFTIPTNHGSFGGSSGSTQ
jgi:hypothetical protein